jgi:hypothetical protein
MGLNVIYITNDEDKIVKCVRIGETSCLTSHPGKNIITREYKESEELLKQTSSYV